MSCNEYTKVTEIVFNTSLGWIKIPYDSFMVSKEDLDNKLKEQGYSNEQREQIIEDFFNFGS